VQKKVSAMYFSCLMIFLPRQNTEEMR